MPTYDLACRTCGHRFELFRMRLLRDGEAICPECGSPDTEKGVGGGMLGAGTRSSSRPTSVADRGSCGSGGFV